MDQHTCIEDGCDKPAIARGWCRPHYSRWYEAKRTRGATPEKPCKGCGEPIQRTSSIGPIRDYCTSDCRPRCSVEGCERPVHANAMCVAHGTRAARYGDPLAPKVRMPNEGSCAVDGCEKLSRKRGWCEAHWVRWRKYGDPGALEIGVRMAPGTGRPAPRNPRGSQITLDDCLVCTSPNRTGAFRSGRFCSAACQVLWHRHGGKVPANPACARCGTEIDLLTTGKNGRRKRADSKLCKKCKTMHSRHWASPGELALRDGPYCQLCGCDVDLSAMFPDVMRASVDHILPRAWGGSDEPENLQLAHLHCNHVKSDRHGGRSWRSTA